MWKIIITIILTAVELCLDEYQNKKGQNDDNRTDSKES